MSRHRRDDIAPRMVLTNPSDQDFAKKVQEGEILAAGTYFACGSSREQAAICLKAARVSVVIAASFARIFRGN